MPHTNTNIQKMNVFMIWNIEKIQLFQPNMSFRLVGPFRDLHFLFGYFWFFFSLSQRYLNYIKNADTSAIVCQRSSFLYMALHSISVRDLAQVHNQVLHFFFSLDNRVWWCRGLQRWQFLCSFPALLSQFYAGRRWKVSGIEGNPDALQMRSRIIMRRRCWQVLSY